MSSGVFPPTPPPRMPGLASCSPERYSLHTELASWFRHWCRDRNISVRDLAVILDGTLALAQKKLDGRSPVTAVDVCKFPTRYRAELALGIVNVGAAHDSDLRAHG